MLVERLQIRGQLNQAWLEVGQRDHHSSRALGLVGFRIFGTQHTRLEQGKRRARDRRTESAVLCGIQAMAGDAIGVVDGAPGLDQLFGRQFG